MAEFVQFQSASYDERHLTSQSRPPRVTACTAASHVAAYLARHCWRPVLSVRNRLAEWSNSQWRGPLVRPRKRDALFDRLADDVAADARRPAINGALANLQLLLGKRDDLLVLPSSLPPFTREVLAVCAAG